MGSLVTDRIISEVVGFLDAENDFENNYDDQVEVRVIAEVDQLRFILISNFPIVGSFTINYWRSA